MPSNLPAIPAGSTRPRNDPSPAPAYSLQLEGKDPVHYASLQELGAALRKLPGSLTTAQVGKHYVISLNGVQIGTVWTIGGPGTLRATGGPVGRPRLPDDQLKAPRRPNRNIKRWAKELNDKALAEMRLARDVQLFADSLAPPSAKR